MGEQTLQLKPPSYYTPHYSHANPDLVSPLYPINIKKIKIKAYAGIPPVHTTESY